MPGLLSSLPGLLFSLPGLLFSLTQICLKPFIFHRTKLLILTTDFGSEQNVQGLAVFKYLFLRRSNLQEKTSCSCPDSVCCSGGSKGMSSCHQTITPSGYAPLPENVTTLTEYLSSACSTLLIPLPMSSLFFLWLAVCACLCNGQLVPSLHSYGILRAETYHVSCLKQPAGTSVVVRQFTFCYTSRIK